MNKTETFVLILILVVAFIGIYAMYKGVGKAIDYGIDPLDTGFAPIPRIAPQPIAVVPQAQPTTIASTPPPSYFVPPEEVPETITVTKSWMCQCIQETKNKDGIVIASKSVKGGRKSVSGTGTGADAKTAEAAAKAAATKECVKYCATKAMTDKGATGSTLG